MFGLLIFWCAVAGLVGLMADKRGRSGFGWTLIAAALTPMVAVALLYLLPDKSDDWTATIEITVVEMTGGSDE
jgi:hypothetical protein